MGRAPCGDKNGLKKGPWTPEEDKTLIDYIQKHGYGSWRTLPKNAGLQRCGKSCMFRWANYLQPNTKRGRSSFEEEKTIIQLHNKLGNNLESESTETADSFKKNLTASDVSCKLSVPTKFLLGNHHKGGDRGRPLMVMDNHTQRMYEFMLSTCRGSPYKKPVFVKEWLKYSRDKQLQAGQTIYFWKNDHEDFYRIQVLLQLI